MTTDKYTIENREHYEDWANDLGAVMLPSGTRTHTKPARHDAVDNIYRNTGCLSDSTDTDTTHEEMRSIREAVKPYGSWWDSHYALRATLLNNIGIMNDPKKYSHLYGVCVDTSDVTDIQNNLTGYSEGEPLLTWLDPTGAWAAFRHDLLYMSTDADPTVLPPDVFEFLSWGQDTHSQSLRRLDY